MTSSMGHDLSIERPQSPATIQAKSKRLSAEHIFFNFSLYSLTGFTIDLGYFLGHLSNIFGETRGSISAPNRRNHLFLAVGIFLVLRA